MWTWERHNLKKGKQSVQILSIKGFRRLIFEWFFVLDLELDLIILTALFQLSMFYDSVILWLAQINLSWSIKLNTWTNFREVSIFVNALFEQRSNEAFCLCRLTSKLCFLSVSWCNVAYSVWNLFCITLRASKARKCSVIIQPFIDLQFHWSHLHDPTCL